MSIDHLSLILAIPALVAVFLAVQLGYHRRQALDARANALLMWMTLGLAANALGYGIEIRLATIAAKLPWIYVRYVGSMVYVLTMLLFTLWCTGRDRWLTRNRIAFLSLPLMLGILALATNDLHHLYYPQVWLDQSLSVPQLRHTVGPLYYAFYLYVMGLAFWGLVRLIEVHLAAPQAYRPGASLILAGSLISLVGFMFYLAGFRLCGVLNATSFFMVVNAILLAVGVLRFELMAFTPITAQVVIRQLDLGLLVLDRSLRVIESNRAASRLLGLPGSSLSGRRLSAVLAEGDPVLELCSAGRDASLRLSRGNFELALSLQTLSNATSQAQGLMLCIHDITQLRGLENSLREAEARTRLIIDNSPDLLWMMSIAGEFTYLSPSWQRVMGYAPQELLGRHYRCLVHPEDLKTFETYLAEVAITGAALGMPEFRSRQADGQYRWHASNVLAIRDASGQLTSLVGISRDIHEQKLEHAEKESLLNELQLALGEIRTLSGIVPICASCKQIRDDEGYWHQVEKYVQQHSHAQFSHSLCPDCIRKLYPELPSNQKTTNKFKLDAESLNGHDS